MALTKGRTQIVLCVGLMVALGVAGLYIRREAIASGFFADDYAQYGMLHGYYPLARSRFNLFSFSNGTRAEGEQLMRAGFFPWWADPTVRIGMFRPLASLMSWSDDYLFGQRALAYHLHSALWWVGLLCVVGAAYWHWLGRTAAVLALALYVFDESHGIALGWICNRSAIVSTLLSVLALRFYTRYRERASVSAARISCAFYAAALGFGEYAVSMFGYFVAYECVRASNPIPERIRSLTPLALLLAIYVGARSAMAVGMQRSGLYVEPLSEPLGFLVAVLHRLPVFVSDMLFALSADYWTFGAPFTYRAVERGWVSPHWIYDLEPWRNLQTVIGVFGCIALGGIAAVLARHRRGSHALWLLLGEVLSLIPVCGSFPSSRLTIVAAFGFMPSLAEFALYALKELATQTWRARSIAVVAVSLLAWQLVLPIRFEREESVRIYELTRRVRGAITQLEVDDAVFANQEVVLLNAPEVGTSMYFPLTRRRYHRSVPRRCWYLSLAPVAYQLARTGIDTFTIRFVERATVLETPHEQILRSPTRQFSVGERVDVGSFQVTVTELYEGRPKALSVQFDRPLEDSSLLFMLPSAHGYERARLPAVGESILVPAPELPDPGETTESF